MRRWREGGILDVIESHEWDSCACDIVQHCHRPDSDGWEGCGTTFLSSEVSNRIAHGQLFQLVSKPVPTLPSQLLQPITNRYTPKAKASLYLLFYIFLRSPFDHQPFGTYLLHKQTFLRYFFSPFILLHIRTIIWFYLI
jgi:hypothetical protein